MKFEIRTTTQKLGVLDKDVVLNKDTDFVGVGSLIEYQNKKYSVSSVLVRKDGTIQLIV